MATITIQNAVDRISNKTKELIEALKVLNGTQDASIASIETTIQNIKNDVTSLTSTKADKQIIGNVDFKTIQELRTSINDDEFVAISMATGEKVTGRIADTGSTPTEPIIVDGFSSVNNTIKFGQITIANDLSISGGKEIYSKQEIDALLVPISADIAKLKQDKVNIDLSNANVGSAHAGKIFQVKPDGTIEYITKPKQYEIKTHTYFSGRNPANGTKLTIPNGEEIISISINFTNEANNGIMFGVVEKTLNNWYYGISDESKGGHIQLQGNIFKQISQSSYNDRASYSIRVFTRKEI